MKHKLNLCWAHVTNNHKKIVACLASRTQWVSAVAKKGTTNGIISTKEVLAAFFGEKMSKAQLWSL